MTEKDIYLENFRVERANIQQINNLEERISTNEQTIESSGSTLDQKHFLKKRLREIHFGRIVFFLELGFVFLTFFAGISEPTMLLTGMFSPFVAIIIWIFGRTLISISGKKEYVEKYVPERETMDRAIRNMRAEISEYTREVERLKKKLFLPQALWPYVEQLCGYFENERAETPEEAFDLLTEDLKHNQRVNELQEQIRQAQAVYDAVEEELTEMRWARASAEQAENQARWAELEAEMEYIYRSR